MDLFLAIVSLVRNSCHDHCPGQGGKEVEIDLAEPSSWGDNRLRAGPASVHKKRTGKLEKGLKKKKNDMPFFHRTSCPHHAELPFPGGPQLAAQRNFSIRCGY